MADLTLKQASEAYLKHLAATGKKPATISTYSRDFDVILGYLGESTKLSALQAARIGKFVKSDSLLQQNGKARAERTVAKTVRVLRMFLVWCEETKRIKKLPLPADFPMGHSLKATDTPEASDAGTEPAERRAAARS